ncbi:hypothetical protein PIB30_071237 [Stylosanthes scabra]|uniref:Uncharacterized protein n=1 Tax=Stylosanthes scabra TaxID=79078 RepID=A0ABU6SPP4_9FABA|nr:hypothetical protein [Stylosanthes scabra]
MAEGSQSGEDELPVFDGIGSGYRWSILAQQFWNARGVLRNPNADWDTFDLAFPHQFQPDIRPILPEICWKEVKDWEIEWVETRARLLRQPYPETTKPQPEQGIIAAESQEKKEVEEDVDSDSTSNEIDAEGAKLEENQDLNLGQSDSAAEENALIDAKVNTVVKEEGGDTVNEGGD